jgi:hypothetical protein
MSDAKDSDMEPRPQAEAPIFDSLEAPAVSKTDEALASLEKRGESEEDKRLEERFLWIVVCTMLLNIIWFRDSANATLPVVALVLELMVLVILARKCHVDEAVILIHKAATSFTKGS